jgi:hypothetical protein
MTFSQLVVLLAALLAAGLMVHGVFSPVRHLPLSFFKQLCAIAAVLWALIGLRYAQAGVLFFGLAVVCAAAWASFCAGKIFFGKILLGAGAGLGVTCGILSATPPALAGVPPAIHLWLLVSLYLSSALLGAALVAVLIAGAAETLPDLPAFLLQRAAKTVLALAGLRVLLLLASGIFYPRLAPAWGTDFTHAFLDFDRNGLLFLFRLVMGVIFPLGLSVLAWKFADRDMRREARGVFSVVLVSVLLGESLALYLRF